MMAKKEDFGTTITKQLKISKAEQNMLLAVLIAALLLGVAIVVSINLIKYIAFNAEVLTAKDEAIGNYSRTMKNIGVCKDADNNGSLSDKELDDCRPNEINTDEVPGTLRDNVMSKMANNKDLESVARTSLDGCYDNDGKKIDFNKLYQSEGDSERKEQYLSMMKMCSALRVIPDALPAKENVNAALASLNQVFLLTGIEPESLAPNTSDTAADDLGVDTAEGADLGTEETTMILKSSNVDAFRLLENMEKSIREFHIKRASLEWSSDDRLELQANVVTYYVGELTVAEKTKLVPASDKKKTGVK